MCDVVSERKVAVESQRAQLFVFKECGKCCVVIEEDQVSAREKGNKCFEDVDCSPNKMAIELPRRHIEGTPSILIRPFPPGPFDNPPGCVFPVRNVLQLSGVRENEKTFDTLPCLDCGVAE